MNHDDKSLKEILQNVEVPGDLKARLHRIAELENVTEVLADDSHQPALPRRSGFRIGVVVAAVAAMAGFVIASIVWTGSGKQSQIAEGGPDESVEYSNEISDEPDPGGAVKANTEINRTPDEDIAISGRLLVLRMEANAELMEQRLEQAEIDRLREQLAEIRRRNRQVIAANERSSIVSSMAGQAAFDMGVGLVDVQQDMLRVIERYPNTRGAELADAFIKNHNL